jgi:D-arabinose 1-dehydrogenase-like Zn-dependent alcohol dehydrogenase
MNLCSKVHRIGFDLPGGFAEFVKAPIRNLVVTTLGRESAILTDAGATMLHALKKAEIKTGDNTVVVGVGGLGTFAVQLAKLMGSKVVALDINDEKLAFAQKLGADEAINIEESDSGRVREFLEKDGGKLADVVVDLVGNEFSQKLCIRLLVPTGKVIQVGYSDSSYKNVELRNVVYGEFQILGSLASTLLDVRQMTWLAETGKVKLSVTNQYKLDDINSAIAELEQNKILGRAIILPR